jgi:cell fate regulator YaaT (PSP1 superfamily)
MGCDHDHKDCKLDMGRGCMFCGCEGHTGDPDTTESGNDPGVCVCEGCFKLHETDWLADYPSGTPTDIFEVRFKNTRKGYYRNIHTLPLRRGDIVAVEASPGHDIGIVSLTGDMMARQMKRVGFNPQNGEFKAIYRKAKPYDIEKWQEAITLEHETMIRSRQIAKEMKLDMKIGDVEYQGDRIKAIFYYIADGRVDFRELIKVFASEFGIKVEMKQIGARQEAGRIGGLGSCGRELCCASWIASFSSITTGAARTQDISLNPQKLAGQCCKLKCCLVYELDAYIDARKSLPRVNEPLQALDGEYYLISSDVLRGTMSFSTVKGAAAGNIVLTIAKVREVMDMNRKGRKPDTLVNMQPQAVKEEEPVFVNMVGEESITRFDNSRKRERGGRNRGEGDRNRDSRDNRGENRGNRGNGNVNRENRDNRGNRDAGHASNSSTEPQPQDRARDNNQSGSRESRISSNGVSRGRNNNRRRSNNKPGGRQGGAGGNSGGRGE